VRQLSPIAAETGSFIRSYITNGTSIFKDNMILPYDGRSQRPVFGQ